MQDLEKTMVTKNQTIRLPEFETRAHLIILYPRELFRQIPLKIGKSILGRGIEADIRLDDGLVSRSHCEIHWDGKTVRIRDLNSTNGIFIDGQEVKEAVLDSENRLQIGKMVLKIDFKDSSEEAFDRELFEAATTDPLTKISNRRTFLDRCGGESALARRNDYYVHTLLLDVDHFKKVNDQWGHQAGDMVLKEIARLLKEEKRESDLLARYGGEEFILFFSGIGLEDAYRSAERLRIAVEKQIFVWNDVMIPVTISLGLSSKKGKSIPKIEEMIAEADKLLYVAKENGRNQVAIET